ncbi:DUF3040 domain-containing protein [Actinomycetospora sp. CA-053990]|uniref:DUF3040 domain-containing protein n=1 Tax=Actinomycetospora sp. CA-053990 TaxID=3239891 RepID=UPI003D92B246
MEQPEEPDRAAEETAAERAVDPYRAPFDAMVRALAAQDPRFVRRVSVPGPRRLAVGHLMLLAGLVSTLLLGVLPLAIGVHTGSVVLLVIGALGSTLLPAGAPLAVRIVLHRMRPLMR